jgi:hypothetical protein
MPSRRGKNPRPRVFIGSSKEGRAIAEYIQLGLFDEVDSKVWHQGIFGLSATAVESLEQATRDYEFAVLVLTPDDVGQKRGQQKNFPRDNVLFELGLFMGSMGRERTFIVCPRDESLELPSDLAGVTTANYMAFPGSDWRSVVGPVCTEIKSGIRRCLGIPDPVSPRPAKTGASQPMVARRRRRRSLGTARTVGPKRAHHVVDISVTGALLETEGEIPLGQLLELDLNLEDRARARVMAKVVRVQQPEWGRVGGVGVEFTKYAADAKRVIEEYVDADERG